MGIVHVTGHSTNVNNYFYKAGSAEFQDTISALHAKSERYVDHLTLHDDYDSFDCYLMRGRQAGFAFSKQKNIVNQRELANVFSTVSGTGVFAVQKAVSLEDNLWLYCVADLFKFYNQFGFEMTRREKNWTVGKPDVLYMSLKK